MAASKKTDSGKSKKSEGEKASPVEETRAEPVDPDDELPFTVVGIGASAGGFAALKAFFAQVPAHSGLAFVVVVHLSPQHESHLVELLQPHLSIPIHQVMETVRIEKNRVYVIPPNANLDAIDTHLRLTKLESLRHERAPIDHFFRTLAASHGRKAIGVILSGTGSDGTLGLRRIKEGGGLTVVQDPNEAEYDGMPRSALVAAPVDLVLPVEEIPAAAMRFAQTRPRLELTGDDDAAAAETRQFLQKVFTQVRARTGRDFTQYKRSTILRRISRRMQFNHIREPSAYIELLRKLPEEAHALADDLLITVTTFFRDPEVFEVLERIVVPKLLQDRAAEDPIRVWSVGCATGEEAYSLAMLLAEAVDRRQSPVNVQIFATDLHEPSLAQAREGLYPGDIVADVSPERLKKFFHQENDSYRVRKELRDLVLFAPHNVLSDPPFSKLDLVSCRNLLIYLNRDLHQQVAELFHYALKPGGFIVLGTSENLDANALFQVEDKKACLYRRRNVPGPEPRLPVFPLVQAHGGHRLHRTEPHTEVVQYASLHQRIVMEHSAPGLLVSPDDNVLHVSAGAGRYLVPPEGPITPSVFKLIRPELRVELHAALSEARRSKKETRSRPVSVRFNGEVGSLVGIRAQPSMGPDQQGFVAVSFTENESRIVRTREAERTEGTGGIENTGDESRLRKLQGEKDLAEQRLQQLIEEHETGQEELKASNEELHSTNEELRSTLEELETSKEELQSINEELQTVNQENRHKVEQLGQLSSDLQNLFIATDIGTLFLDRDLRILRFTPKIEELFNVRPTDRGRPISDFTTKLGYDGLMVDAQNVLDHLVPIEHEVQDASGRWYLTRVLPYRSSDDRIAGIVVTLVEITRQKAAEEDVRRAQQAAEQILEGLPEPLLILTPDLRIKSANEAFYEYFRTTPEETVGYPVYALGNRHWDVPELRGLLDDIRANESTPTDCQITHDFGQGRRTVLLTGRRLDNLILLGFHDITRRHDMEQALRSSEDRLAEENRHKDEYLAMLGHELRNPLGAIRHATQVLGHLSIDDSRFVRAHRVLDRQSLHMGRIIDGLLDVSRIARGKVHLDLRTVDLRDVVTRLLECRGPDIASRGLDLSSELGSPGLWVRGDETRLTQIFDNLLGNAIKFTYPPGRITVSFERDQTSAVFRIKDTGIGIRREMLERLFTAFQQEEQEPARTSGGLGLGLALAKGLVELHQGTIAAHSAGPGHGSEFVVRLPLSAPPTEVTEEDHRETPPREILVVEDNEDAGEMLRDLLEVEGHHVTMTRNAPDALQLLRQRGVDVVLCDLGLPGMSGYDFARSIRANPSLRHVPLVALTGYGQPEDRKRTKEAGFDDHLVKPVHTEALNDTFRRLEERASTRC